MSTPLSDAKAFSGLQARAALAGMQLLKIEGEPVRVVLVDRKGQPHRIRNFDELESALLAIGAPA